MGWGTNLSDFQPENGVYQGTRAANFSSLYEIPNKKKHLRSKVSRLIQRVLLRGQRKRICHKELRQVTPTKLYCKSTELPVDWLVYYDAISRVCRGHTELYVTVCHSSRTNNSLQNQTIFRRNIFLPNVRCPFVKNPSVPDRVQNKNSNVPKTYTYYYGENQTLQNLPYTQELSFSNNILKIYTTVLHQKI